jgi:ribosomal protein S18 acetylase RimI-like enzyme
MDVTIRLATKSDLPAIARLAGLLVREHHGWDALRFMLPEHVEQGYERWFGRELENREAVILAAESEGKIVGYAYGCLEERDWNALRDACGALHDILVEPAARGRGIAGQLLEAFCKEMRALEAPRVILMTATANTGAHKLFEKHGFRRTMIEMARELD